MKKTKKFKNKFIILKPAFWVIIKSKLNYYVKINNYYQNLSMYNIILLIILKNTKSKINKSKDNILKIMNQRMHHSL